MKLLGQFSQSSVVDTSLEFVSLLLAEAYMLVETYWFLGA